MHCRSAPGRLSGGDDAARFARLAGYDKETEAYLMRYAFAVSDILLRSDPTSEDPPMNDREGCEPFQASMFELDDTRMMAGFPAIGREFVVPEGYSQWDIGNDLDSPSVVMHDRQGNVIQPRANASTVSQDSPLDARLHALHLGSNPLLHATKADESLYADSSNGDAEVQSSDGDNAYDTSGELLSDEASIDDAYGDDLAGDDSVGTESADLDNEKRTAQGQRPTLTFVLETLDRFGNRPASSIGTERLEPGTEAAGFSQGRAANMSSHSGGYDVTESQRNTSGVLENTGRAGNRTFPTLLERKDGTNASAAIAVGEGRNECQHVIPPIFWSNSNSSNLTLDS